MDNEVRRPYVVASVAVSADGFIDDASAERLVLSGDEDFARVRALRAGADALLVGAGTLRADDPRLEHPLSAVVTASGNLDPELRWFRNGARRLVYTTDAGAERSRDLAAEVVRLGTEVGVGALLDDLAARGVRRLVVEGGRQVHTAFLAADAVDELQLAVAPLLVGDGTRFAGPARYPWPTTRRMTLAGTRTLGDVVLLRYLLNADRWWLARAAEQAERCPPSDTAFAVGAVLVDQDGNELATGFSRETDPHVHAEEAALAKVAGDPRLATATLYSTMEPCARRASRPRTCADLILAAGIPRVVYAEREPPTFVAHPEGHAALEAAGVSVTERPGGR